MIEIRVIAMPGPQGSKKAAGRDKKGRAILVESSAKVKPWREAVVWAARANGQRITGPVAVEMIFTWPKPSSAPKKRVTYPDRRPDIDKLCRSTLDSLVASGTIEDDARVVRLLAHKVFPLSGAGALDVPGAVIRISSILEAANAKEGNG